LSMCLGLLHHPQSGTTNEWLRKQGPLSIRDLWMKAHGYA